MTSIIISGGIFYVKKRRLRKSDYGRGYMETADIMKELAVKILKGLGNLSKGINDEE